METNNSTDETEVMAQAMFTNLVLLGLDVEDMESVYKIPFNKDMFKSYNKTGANAVLHFLFFNLNSTVSGEQFRDCWPIVDKKSEAQFRKSCFNWLVGIRKSEADVQWPVLNASSLQYPGGRKWIHILFRLSIHVLKQKRPDNQQYLVNPSWNSTPDLAAVKIVSIQDNTNLDLRAFMNQMYITNTTHKMWNNYASELVQGIREKSKALREIEQEKRSVVTRLAENAIKYGCTLPVKRTLNMFDGDKDDTNVKRRQRLQRVKASWEKVHMHDKGLEEARKILKAILDHSNSTDMLEANDIGVRIPGLLLKQCEKEIRQRQIDNVYIGGRLNMVSLLQLWNLCLHLYLEQLEDAELPDVTKDVPALSMQAHKLHSFLKEIQALREEISSVFIPELEQSIERLRRESRVVVEDATSLSQSSLQLTTPTLSSVNKSHSDNVTPAGLITPKAMKKRDTPTVLAEMMASIANATQKTVQPSRLNFEQLKTKQRSSPVVSSTAKDSKMTQMGKTQRAVSMVSEQNVLKSAKRKVHISKPKASNSSFSSEKGSAETNQSILDQMALSVADSVIENRDLGRLRNSGHKVSDANLNIDQNSISSYLQTLMSELDQDSSSEANATLEDSFAPFKHGILLDKSPMKPEHSVALESPLESSLKTSFISPSSPMSGSHRSIDSRDRSLQLNLMSSMKSPSPLLKSPDVSLEPFSKDNLIETLKSPSSVSKSPNTQLDSSLNTKLVSMPSSTFRTSPNDSIRIHNRLGLNMDSVLSTPPPPPSTAWNIQKQVDDLFSQGCAIFDDLDDDDDE